MTTDTFTVVVVVCSVLLVGSLFAGIGGFDLGLERAGMRTIWFCEQDDFCRRVLARHWPDVPCHPDVRDINAAGLDPVDVLAGGFPCQDLSYAGKGAGIDGARSGLWAEYARLIGELRPRYVIVENVPALLARGMERVLGDLAACGYDAEWDCMPAQAVGAPHRRDRVWLVAYPASGGTSAVQLAGLPHQPRSDGEARHMADTNGARLEGHRGPDGRTGELAAAARSGPNRAGVVADADEERRGGRPRERRPGWRGEPTDGGWWRVEPGMGRVAHGIPNRVDRLRSLGNALIPQIAEWIGRRIVAHEEGG